MLKSHDGMVALIGERIYPLFLPQDPVLPAIVYQQISGPRSYSHSGDQNLTRPRFQFSCWDHTYAGTKELAAQLRSCFSGNKFNTIRAGFVANEMDDYDSVTKDYRAIVDLMFWVAEV